MGGAVGSGEVGQVGVASWLGLGRAPGAGSTSVELHPARASASTPVTPVIAAAQVRTRTTVAGGLDRAAKKSPRFGNIMATE